MTAALSRSRDAARPAYVVERIRDRGAARALLERDIAYSAYALAHLEPERFRAAEWYLATGPAGEQALVVHSVGSLGRALFALGDTAGVEAVLALHPGPRFSFGSLRPEHRAAVERFFVLTRPQIMSRMAVTRETFVPAGEGAVRLRAADAAAVNRLYSMEGGPTAYRGSHLEEGVYYGVRVNGALVSIAGTHAVSESEGVAVVGNVFTHPRYRGRGLARIATGAVTAHLLQRCRLVVLTVETNNLPAVAVYRRLGYMPRCTLHESPLIRKEPVGALSLARRVVAGWRGRAEGKEVVLQ